jgi:hypothetical protein
MKNLENVLGVLQRSVHDGEFKKAEYYEFISELLKGIRSQIPRQWYNTSKLPPAEPVALLGGRPLEEAKIPLLFFRFSLIPLLILYILPDLLLIHSQCRYAIASTPKMITPIGLLLQPWITFEHLYSCFAL